MAFEVARGVVELKNILKIKQAEFSENLKNIEPRTQCLHSCIKSFIQIDLGGNPSNRAKQNSGIPGNLQKNVTCRYGPTEITKFINLYSKT